MAQARCKNGHLYDTEIYGDTCPYCAQGNSVIEFGETELEVEDFDPMDQLGKTVPVSTITPETINKTTPPQEYMQKQQEIGKTQPVFRPKQGIDPVVGWLVCVDGHNVGSDYRLLPRTNSIGRGREMDVQLKGDDTISSDTHAKIDYDALNNSFYLLPGNNRNPIYLNNVPVYQAVMLNPYDRIRLGKTDVLFVPFCCDRFVWPTAASNEAGIDT